MSRVVIVGGGVTGLAAAYELEKTTNAEIHVYEASDRLGGKLRTDLLDDLVVEGGPDCFFALKPEVMDLVRELGREDQLVTPKQREFAMLVNGKLHSVPAGLVSLTTANPEAVHEATFLSEECKARVLDEPKQPAKRDRKDESIRSFFDRRFGVEFTRLVVEPLLAGTHGGDPDQLSIQALYPAYPKLEAMQGYVTSPAPTSAGPKRPTFYSFRNGMQDLVDMLAAALQRTTIHLNRPVRNLDEMEGDQALLAIPAPQAATVLPHLPSLQKIPHSTTSIATFAFRREDIGHGLRNTGFLVPPSTEFPITGATWSSEKWPGRAPEETVLLRVFGRGVLQLETARTTIQMLLDIRRDPTYQRIDLWQDAQPQYNVGHLDLLAEIDEAMRVFPRITLAGTSYRGVGIPDCLRQGRQAARTLAERL